MLPPLLAQRLESGDDYEVIVVDNASTDGTGDYLGALGDHRLRVIVNERNEGFAAPNNCGFRAAQGEFVAALNNDTQPDERWLAALVETARQHERAGSVASQMVFANAPDTINSAGISIDRAGIAWERLVGQRVGGEAAVAREVFGASAGAALYRRAMLEELGGFDERFFCYLEDVDLAWRARLAGWNAWYAPGALVRHAHSGTSVEGSPFKNWHLGRNKVWSIAKCYPAPGLQRYLAAVVAYDLASLPYTMLTKRDHSPLSGRLAALRHLGPILAERRRLHDRYPGGWERTSAWMEPLKPPLAVFQRYQRLRRVLAG